MRSVKLEELCEIKSSKRIYQNEYVESGVAFYRGKEISELSRGDTPQIDLYISREQFEELKKKFGVPKKGDLLITSVGTIGNTWVSDGREFYYKDGNITQIIDNENINTNYISYLFKSNIVKRQYQCSGTAQSALTIEKLNNIIVPMTTLNNQQKITNILDKAQELIDKRKEQIEACDELIKSLFYHMFGDPFNNINGFKMTKLGDVSEINPKKKEVAHLDDSLEVSFVPMEFVGTKGQFDGSNTKFIGEVYKGFTYFKTDDVIFAKITPCMENGKGAIAKKLKNSIGFGSTEFHVLRPKKDSSNCVWLYQLTSLNTFRKMAEKNMTGSAGQKRVPSNFLQKIEVAVPPLELQNEFAQKVEKIEQQKHLLEQSLTELENNFNSLMQRAFKGELF